jgi:hypothetical protein
MTSDALFDDEAVARPRRSITRLSRLLNEVASEEGLIPKQASVLAVAPPGVGRWGWPSSPTSRAQRTMLCRIVSKVDADGLLRRTPNPPINEPPS